MTSSLNRLRSSAGPLVLVLALTGCHSLAPDFDALPYHSRKHIVPESVAEFTSLGKWRARQSTREQRSQGDTAVKRASYSQSSHSPFGNEPNRLRLVQLGKPAISASIEAGPWRQDSNPAEKTDNVLGYSAGLEAGSGDPRSTGSVLDYSAGLESRRHTNATQQTPIDFKTALQMAAGVNPRVAIAGARIDQAFARLHAAKVLWLPSIRFGTNFNKHEGSIQEVTGPVFDVSRSSLQAGLGTFAIGAGSPAVPGISARFHTADAVFQPGIAAAGLAASQAASAVVNNDLLLDTSLAYLNLLFAVQQQVIAAETVKNAEQLAKLTVTFAKSGQGPQADADRAKVELVLRKNDVSKAQETTKVASARLAELLRLDPANSLQPLEPTVTEIELVQPDSSVHDLVATGLSTRPELEHSRHLVREAVQRMKREKFSPYLPSVVVGASYGGFGGSPGSSIDNFRDRLDLDAVAYWEIRNLGFGEHAARNSARSRFDEAKMRELQAMDRVAREIAEALAQVQSRKQQIAVAQTGITAAVDSYKHNLVRIRNAKGLPIELLQAIQALDQVRREYLRSVIEYNRAQFKLFRAIGWPAAE